MWKRKFMERRLKGGVLLMQINGDLISNHFSRTLTDRNGSGDTINIYENVYQFANGLQIIFVWGFQLAVSTGNKYCLQAYTFYKPFVGTTPVVTASPFNWNGNSATVSVNPSLTSCSFLEQFLDTSGNRIEPTANNNRRINFIAIGRWK